MFNTSRCNPLARSIPVIFLVFSSTESDDLSSAVHQITHGLVSCGYLYRLVFKILISDFSSLRKDSHNQFDKKLADEGKAYRRRDEFRQHRNPISIVMTTSSSKPIGMIQAS